MKVKREVWWLALLGGILLGTAAVAAVAAAPGGEPEERVIVFGGHGRLGVEISDVTAERVAELKLPGESGVVIEEVEEDSPAAKVGLQKNDVILSFAGERVRSAAQLRRLVEETPAGRQVAMEVSRDGQKRTVEVALAERTFFRGRMPRVEIVPRIEVAPRIQIPEIHIFGRGPRLGISADELTPQLAEYFGVKQGKGVLVREVMEGSAAAKAGLKAGDVIVRVGDKDIARVSDLRNALAEAEKETTLGIVRERREQTLKVTLEEPTVGRTPRRTAALEWIDADELHHLQAELEAEVARIQAETQEVQQEVQREIQQELQKEQLRWQEEQQRWQRELQQELQKMQREVRTRIVI